MNQELIAIAVPRKDFEIRLSGFFLLMKWFVRFAATLILLVEVFESFKPGQHYFFVNGIAAFVFYMAIAEFGIRTFPRKVSLEGDMVIFHKMPKIWISLNGLPIPVGINQRAEFKLDSIYLEWIGRTLSFNDMDKGKSIRLAAGKQAMELAEWFKNAGVREPVGG